MVAASPIRFYFDFNSTFSYLAIQRIDDIATAHGRRVDWRALSLGHLFQAQGIAPPPTIPAKFAYLATDFARSCEMAGLPHRLPAPFPPDVKLARQLFWYLKARDEMRAHVYARAVSRAVFGQGHAVATQAQILAVLADGPEVSEADVAAAATDAVAKQAVVTCLEDAKADGVIGAPFMILDGEPFWGADRLEHLIRRLASA